MKSSQSNANLEPMHSKFDIFAIAAPTGWKVLDIATGATGNGDAGTALAAVGARRGARLLLASEAVFSQTVRLPDAQTRALSPAELESALFYEVEPFCGIDRREALVSFSRAKSGEWNVAVASKAQLAGFREEAASARCRLDGIAALPAEFASLPAKETMEALFPVDGPQAPVIAADGGTAFGKDRLVRIAAIAAAALAALCLFDWIWLEASIMRLRPRLAASEDAAAANGNIRRAAEDDENRVRELAAARMRRESAAAELAIARDRWLALFGAFSRNSGDDFAVVSLESAGGLVSAKCISPSATAASAAMARLSAALAENGWTLLPGRVEELAGGMASFTFALSDSRKEVR